MPTGYTLAIKDDITFRQFAMDCARAFGACISLRDEPGGGEKIPEQFEPGQFHAEHLQKSRELLAEVEAMTPEQCAEAAEQDYQRGVESRNKAIANARELQAKYEAMLAEVNAWMPPSAEHVELQNFMRKQIEESINFDCNTSFYERQQPVRIAPEKWRAERIATIRQQISYHEKGQAEEVARTNSRNEWVRLLRESLTK